MLQTAALLQRLQSLVGAFSSSSKRARAAGAWSYYWRLYEGRYGALLCAIVAAVAQSLMLLPVPLIVGYLIDRALPARSPQLVLLAATGIFVALVAYAAFAFLTRYYAFKSNSSAVCRLRSEMLAQWFRFSRSFFSQADQGKLHANMVQDSERVVMMGNVLIEQFLPASLTCLALCVFLFWLDPRVLPIFAVVAPLFILSIRRWEREVSESVSDFRVAAKDFSHGATRLLRSIDLIRQRGADDYELAEQTSLAEKLHRATLKLSWANSQYNCAQSVIIAFAMMAVLALSGLAVITGRMTLGQLLALYASFALLRDRLYTLLQTVPLLVAGNESLIAMWELLQVDDHQPYSGTQRIDFGGNVEFTNVTFGYDEANSVMDIGLTLKPARATAITGPNAAGKTTLVQLLLGFYRPRRGEILMDGINIDKIDLRHVRRQIGVVAQDPLIPSASIAEIISYGFPEATTEVIERAARAAGLDVFIRDLPAGYSSQVGEDGILLSGGQRQRLALARALLGNPKLLILDEPTNHLDPAAVDALMSTLRELPSCPSILLITHDAKVARLTDHVYVMNNGRIIAGGSTDEILQTENQMESFLSLCESPNGNSEQTHGPELKEQGVA